MKTWQDEGSRTRAVHSAQVTWKGEVSFARLACTGFSWPPLLGSSGKNVAFLLVQGRHLPNQGFISCFQEEKWEVRVPSLYLLCVRCLQLKITLTSEWHVLGWRILPPFSDIVYQVRLASRDVGTALLLSAQINRETGLFLFFFKLLFSSINEDSNSPCLKGLWA